MTKFRICCKDSNNFKVQEWYPSYKVLKIALIPGKWKDATCPYGNTLEFNTTKEAQTLIDSWTQQDIINSKKWVVIT